MMLGTPVANGQSRSSTLDRLTGNALWSILRYGSAWITLLILPPFLVHRMSNSAYSTWMLLLQLGTYVQLFDAHMQMSVARYVGRAVGMGDRNYLKVILASVLWLLITGSVAVLVLTSVTAINLRRLFPEIPITLQPEASHALLIIGAGLALTLPCTTLIGGFLGLQRNRVVTVAVIFSKVTAAAGMAWVGYHHGSLTQLALWFDVGLLMAPTYYIFQWCRYRDELPLHFTAGTLSFVAEFSKFYALLAITTLSIVFITGMDLPVVATYDFPAVGTYALAVIYGNMLLIPQGAIIEVVMPAAASLSAAGSPELLGRALLKLVRFASITLCGLAGTLLLVAPLFLRFWLGTKLYQQVLPLALTLIIAQAISLTIHPYRIMVLSVAQQEKVLWSQGLEAIINLVCSIALARRFGAIGVALGTLCGAVAGASSAIIISMRLTHGIRMSRRMYVKAGIFEPLLACLPAIILAVLLWRLDWNLSIAFAFGVAGPLAAIFILWTRNFSQQERSEIVSTVRRKLGFVSS